MGLMAVKPHRTTKCKSKYLSQLCLVSQTDHLHSMLQYGVCHCTLVIRDGYRIPRRRGRQPLGGRQHTNLPDFPKNCMKLRKFWSVEGAPPPLWIGHWSSQWNDWVCLLWVPLNLRLRMQCYVYINNKENQ